MDTQTIFQLVQNFYPIAGWFKDNPTKMDDLGLPLFYSTVSPHLQPWNLPTRSAEDAELSSKPHTLPSSRTKAKLLRPSKRRCAHSASKTLRGLNLSYNRDEKGDMIWYNGKKGYPKTKVTLSGIWLWATDSSSSRIHWNPRAVRNWKKPLATYSNAYQNCLKLPCPCRAQETALHVIQPLRGPKGHSSSK